MAQAKKGTKKTTKATKKAAPKKKVVKKPAKAKKAPKEPKVKKVKPVKEPKVKKEPKAKKAKTGGRRRPEQFTTEHMNPDEHKIIEALQAAGKPLTNIELAELAFDNRSKSGQKDNKKANSRVRNALRRPRATGWIIPIKGIGEGLWAGHWMGYAAPAGAVAPAATTTAAATTTSEVVEEGEEAETAKPAEDDGDDGEEDGAVAAEAETV